MEIFNQRERQLNGRVPIAQSANEAESRTVMTAPNRRRLYYRHGDDPDETGPRGGVGQSRPTLCRLPCEICD